MGEKHEHHHEHHHEDVVVVAPNGADTRFKFHPNEKVEQLLTLAVDEFARRGDLQKGLTYILAHEEKELDNSKTLEAAGIRPGERLKIRSKTTPGDGNASSVL
jgi:uncharacterized protein YggU (UPF0235/DUF167 family)